MARRTKDFEIDKAGLAALFISSDMQAAMTAAGQDVAGAASLTAPYRTGRLAASFRVEPTIATVVTKRGGESRRASGRVVGDPPDAAPRELGHRARAGRAPPRLRYGLPGAYTLGALAATRAARAARRGRRS